MSKLSPQGGFKLSPQASSGVSYAVYGEGSPYSLADSPSWLDFGTKDPALELNAGTYLILARVSIKYNSVLLPASKTIDLKLRRTWPEPIDLGVSTSFITDSSLLSKFNHTAGTICLPPCIYTAKTKETIEIFGSVDVVPSAGTIDITEAEIVAIKIQ